MRHIDLDKFLAEIFGDEEGKKSKARLQRAHKSLAKKRTPRTRKRYIDHNGSGKWKPVKDKLTTILGKKCWYSEVEFIGGPLAIDHYRPTCKYWWLAFDAENYRVSCPWANSPEHNALHGLAGGKGDHFPLFPPNLPATRKSGLPNERPVILDPCNAADCNLVAFQVDGRPILNPAFNGDADAEYRLEQSMLLLNLDHPEFNSKREQLYHDTDHDVAIYEALPEGSGARVTIENRMRQRISATAPFSTAARYYLKLYRHLDWVENILSRH